MPRLPQCVRRALIRCVGAAAKAGYFIPFTSVRQCVKDMALLAGEPRPRRLYSRLVDKTLTAVNLYLDLLRDGVEAILPRLQLAEGEEERLRPVLAGGRGAICVVPHCAGSVIAAARFDRAFSSLVLVREPKSAERAKIQVEIMRRLGLDLMCIRHLPPQTRARRILGSLRQGRFIIGTTDLARKRVDSIEVTMFGERVTLPSWPARFASRRDACLVPAYITIEQGRAMVRFDEPFFEKDIERATARWAKCFERSILASPSDWVFMFDKRWRRILRAAAVRRGG